MLISKLVARSVRLTVFCLICKSRRTRQCVQTLLLLWLLCVRPRWRGQRHGCSDAALRDRMRQKLKVSYTNPDCDFEKASLGSILCHLSSLLLWGFNFGLKPLVLFWNKNSCTKVKKYLVGAKRTKAMTTEGNWSFKKCPSMATAFSSSRSNFWFVKSLSKDSWLSYNPFVQTCWANMFVFPNRIENIKPKQATAAAHHFLLCSWPVRLVSICFTAREDLSQNGIAILATISTTHNLLSTSSKQRNNSFKGDCQLRVSVLQQVAQLCCRKAGKLLWHVSRKRRHLHNSGCSAAQVTATPSFALELLGLHLTAWS